MFTLSLLGREGVNLFNYFRVCVFFNCSFWIRFVGVAFVSDVACIDTSKMNTKTMRLPPRRVLTSNKRKDREGFDTLKPSLPTPTTTTTKLPKPTTVVHPQVIGSAKLSEPASSNQLLAGYLAHEFLSKGTLFGQPWDPSGAEASGGFEPKNNNNNNSNNYKKTKLSQKGKEAEPIKENYQRYVEVSNLLKGEGAHLPGVFNPSQLARFLQM